MVPAIVKTPLYEQDLVLWCADTVAKLRTGDFASLDIEHLVEEIEGLAGRDKTEVENRLDVLLCHVLKRLYVDSAYDYRGWEATIREQQKRLRRLLKQSPSLKNYFAEVFDEVWQDALTDVRQTYPKTAFPDQWQFSREVDVLLSEEFWKKNEA
jgi:hypothetical protein